jgi:ABC-type bacteriocin/lantibiotic exporter with double-glycine peptidase domain
MKENNFLNTFLFLSKAVDKTLFLTQFVKVIFLSVLSGILELFVIGSVLPIIGYIYDPVNMKQFNDYLPYEIASNDQLIYIFSALLLLLLVVSAAIRIYNLGFLNRTIFTYGTDLFSYTYKKILKTDYNYFVEIPESEIIANTTDRVSSVTTGILLPAILIINQSIIFFIILSILMITEPILIILMFVILFLSFYFSNLITKKRIYNAGKLITNRHSHLINSVTETISNIHYLKLSESFKQHLNEAVSHVSAANNARNIISINNQLPKIIIESVALAIFLIGCIVLSVEFKIIVIIAMAFQKLLPLGNAIYANICTIIAYKPSLVALQSLFLKPDDNAQIKFNKLSKDILLISPEKKLNLKGIQKKYSKLEIKKSDFIRISGKTGAGKSLFLKTLVGLLPCSCEVTFNEVSFGRILSSGLPNNIIYMSQGQKLYHNNLEEIFITLNISKKEKMLELINEFELNDIYENYSFNDSFGNNNEKLSGGQKQRLLILIGILSTSKVIIFDETTSGLDIITEEKVYKAIKKYSGEKAILFITHSDTINRFLTKEYKVI